MSATLKTPVALHGDWQQGPMIGFSVTDNGAHCFDALSEQTYRWQPGESPEHMLGRYGFDTLFTTFGTTGVVRAEVYQVPDGKPVRGMIACVLVEVGFTPYTIFVYGTVGELFTLLRVLQPVAAWGVESLRAELTLMGETHDAGHHTDGLSKASFR